MIYTHLQRFLSYFKEIWFLWLLALVFNIITFLVIKFKIHPGNTTMALHYNVLVGVEWYGTGLNLYFIPAIGLVIGLINLSFYKLLEDNANFLSFLSAFATLVVQIILFSAVLFLASIN